MTISNWSEKVSFIWSVKEILRDHYKRHQYGAIILPLCVVRRLDCVLDNSELAEQILDFYARKVYTDLRSAD
jgi:type I restriction enzyme M protein